MVVVTKEEGLKYIESLNIQNPKKTESADSIEIFGDNMNVYLYYYPQSSTKRTWRVRVNKFQLGNK